MSYQVLARKWRPQTFAEVVGQQHVLLALANGLSLGRIHHAYLFSGTRGVGKTTIARLLAKGLNCEQGVSATPCGQCESCQQISQGRFVDLIEIDAASRTKVEDTRELLDNVQYAPARGRYKVYLIDEVHMLSRHSFNALLKTLEEPPEHVKFLLATTDPQKLPVTILSRCLQFHLKALDSGQIRQHLERVLTAENIAFESRALALLARSADGSLRDALSLTDQAIASGGGALTCQAVSSMLGTIEDDQGLLLIEALAQGNADQALALINEAASRGVEWDALLVEMLQLLHRIAMAQLAPLVVNPDMETVDQRCRELARRILPTEVQLYYQIVLTGRKELAFAPDRRMGVEMTLLRALAFAPQADEPPEPARPGNLPVLNISQPRSPAPLVPSAPAPAAPAPAPAAPASATPQARLTIPVASQPPIPQHPTPQPPTPQQPIPQQSPLQQSISQPSTPQQSISQQSTPQQSIPQQSISQQSTPQQPTLQHPIPQQSTPQQSIPQQSIPQQSISQQSTPQQPTLQHPIPQQSTPQQSIPQQSISQQSISQQSISQQSTLQQSIPQQSIPQQSTPQQSPLQQSISQPSTPSQSTLQQSTPQHPLPQQSTLQQSPPAPQSPQAPQPAAHPTLPTATSQVLQARAQLQRIQQRTSSAATASQSAAPLARATPPQHPAGDSHSLITAAPPAPDASPRHLPPSATAPTPAAAPTPAVTPPSATAPRPPAPPPFTPDIPLASATAPTPPTPPTPAAAAPLPPPFAADAASPPPAADAASPSPDTPRPPSRALRQSAPPQSAPAPVAPSQNYRWQAQNPSPAPQSAQPTPAALRSALEHEKTPQLAAKIAAQAIERDEWASQLSQLELPKLVEQLALNCYKTQQQNQICLHMRPTQKQLNTPAAREALASALCKFTGQPVELTVIEDDNPAHRTPQEWRNAIYEEKLANARSAITSDRHIQTLCQLFDAQLDDNSIRPI